jgi:glycerol-3-phosphate dehydrogenase
LQFFHTNLGAVQTLVRHQYVYGDLSMAGNSLGSRNRETVLP